MEAIQEQIKNGKISGGDLLNFFSSNKDTNQKNVIFRLVYDKIKSDPEISASFALILYRSENSPLTEEIYKDIMKNDPQFNESDKNLSTFVSLENLINGDIFLVRNMSEVLTLFLVYKDTDIDLEILNEIPSEYWNYISLYALYLKDKNILHDLLYTDEFYFFNLRPSKEVINMVKNNGDEEFFKMLKYNPPPEKITNKIKLIGPASLSKHYSVKYNKIFYIFGDYHYMLPTCENDDKSEKIDIVDFLKYNILNTNKNIDLFMESQIPTKYKRVKGVKSNYLFRMEEDLSSKNLYHNFRYHHADPRWDRKYKDAVQSARTILQNMKEFPGLVINHREHIKEIKNYIDDNIHAIKLDQIKNPKTEKQLVNIKYPDILKILRKYELDDINTFKIYMSDEAKKFKILLDSTLKTNRNFISNISDELKEKLELFIDEITNIGVAEMDLYLMGRIFRTFKNEPESQNIIIYAGDIHSGNYRDLLLQMGFTEEAYIKRKDPGEPGFQCLDISQFKLPFFS